MQDLLDFANEHKLSRFFLLGHSMGGKVAMQFACKYPERLLGLVVVDIAPRKYAPHHHLILEGLKAVDLDGFTSRNQADEAMARFIPELDVRQFLLKNLYRQEDGRFAWRINLPVLENAASSIGEDSGSVEPSMVPALFVKGNQSQYIRLADEVEITKRFPQAMIAGIEGAGHWVQAEKPDEFTHCVLNFLLKQKAEIRKELNYYHTAYSYMDEIFTREMNIADHTSHWWVLLRWFLGIQPNSLPKNNPVVDKYLEFFFIQ
jgi:pimeloyl-ACP methyl ester carboxylesterase